MVTTPRVVARGGQLAGVVANTSVHDDALGCIDDQGRDGYPPEV
jgi:hypothetical protein